LIPADKDSASYLLRNKKCGNAVVIAVGGAPESLDARPGAFTLLAKNRKGFVRLAIEHGASLVPVFSFGENELFDQVENPKGSFLRSVQEKLRKIMGVALPLFHARGVFRYSFGLMPYRRPIYTIEDLKILERPQRIMGRAHAQFEQACESGDQIDLHKLYLEKLSELFEEHKTQYNVPADKHLTFV
ncbi:PREDICTED: 2-acylglycerol O-acyltransferase 2, partial [Nanorana parkeri]|uniref:2-acylglycerol O-acyltransferase 2 n=1 Tax=Nanorana parkeri TaxID=125878 RepID=UPI0008549250